MLPLLVISAVRYRSRRHIRFAWKWLRRRQSVPLVYFIVFALGGFLSIHLLHMDTKLYPEWYFGQRHSLVCMFLFFLALVFLFRQRRFPWPLIAAALVFTGSYRGWVQLDARSTKAEKARPPKPKPAPLVTWLNTEAAKHGGMVVALRQPQLLAYQTRGVGYHWYYRRTKLHDI
ncbi:MAG: hypothetical protein DRI90_21195 [Deltaproteobacteria bacterium]|nr:MAG: hypothetical protein DRI90_21195 [Deltaproteobacteria bacterium]